MTYLPKAQAARALSNSVPTIDALINTGQLSVDSRGRVVAASLDLLRAQRERRLPEDHPPVLQVVKNPLRRGPSMYLSDIDGLPTDRQKDNDARRLELLRKEFSTVLDDNPEYDFTGYWEVSDSNADLLCADEGVVVSTIGGFGHEAAKFICVADEVEYRARKVIMVEPLTGDEAEKYRVFFPDRVRHTRTII